MIMVESAWGAVSGLLLVRFPRPTQPIAKICWGTGVFVPELY
jgi:hypothetical protein